MRCNVNNPSMAVLVMLLWAHGASAITIGGESGAYLRAPAGATALAMGGAGSASPKYLMAWWNPAGIAALRASELSAGAGIRSMGRTEAFGSFDFRIPPRMGMGMALLYRGDPFIDNLHDENEELLEAKGAYTSLTLKTALSFYVNRQLDIGASIGIYYQSLPTGLDDGNRLTYSSATGIGGFDLCVRATLPGDLYIAIAARNLGAGMQWQIQSQYGLDVTIDDKPMPQFILASSLERRLLGYPLRWVCDIEGDVVDGDFKKLPRPQAVIGNGFEWQRWNVFYIRAGLGDLAVDGTALSDTREYFRTLAFRATLGFGADLSKVRKGMRLNYAFSTDKVWAGVDNAIDVHYEF